MWCSDTSPNSRAMIRTGVPPIVVSSWPLTAKTSSRIASASSRRSRIFHNNLLAGSTLCGSALAARPRSTAAIAAASVIAKVSRDRFMRRMEERYPGWEFAAHVGYSTPEHRAAIERQGVSPLHRMSFQSMAYQQLAR